MLTDIQIINLGLSKISSSRILRINPAQTPLETFMSVNYPQWKKFELTKHRWVFATVDDYILTQTDNLSGVRRPFVYALPNDCLRPIRTKRTEWVQRGRSLYSGYSTLALSYIRSVDEFEFDPLFNEVLACKIAVESAEYVTQSTTKKQTAQTEYDANTAVAKQCNAFVTGSEDIEADDSNFDWLAARYQGS